MPFPYVVQRGDTLYRISRRFGVNLTALLQANPQIRDADYIVPGQVIQIPLRPANIYVIQPGDTFFFIAQRFNIALNDLLAANPGVDPRNLQVGQTIILPISRGMQIVQTDTEYGYLELTDDLALLKQVYPFLHIETIGYSVLGKAIPAVRIGIGQKEVHYNAAIHANEWLTAVLLMKFIEDFSRHYVNGTLFRGYNVNELFEQVSLWLVPMINPDGVELVQEGIYPGHPFYNQLLEWNNGSFNFQNWKANIRGVDLNDQFPAYWEEEKARRSTAGPGPRDYPGEAPLTEPEARAMVDFTRNHRFRLVIAFHTQGEEIYYNYRDLEPPESEAIAQEFARVSGYRPVRLTGSDAGYKDWFILEFRRPGFTVEAGRGVNPLPISQFPKIYEDTVGIMLLGMFV